MTAVNELLPEARYQRRMVHSERNILTKTNPRNREWAPDAFKAVFGMKSRDKALESVASTLSGLIVEV